MNIQPPASGMSRRLIRCGVLLWGLRGTDDPESTEPPQRQG